jgi:hypothetical protein
MEGFMSRSDADCARSGGRPKRRSILGWLAKKIIISLVFMSLLSLVGVGYTVHRKRTLIVEALNGLDSVADRLEQNDRDSAAETLRQLRTKLENLSDRGGDYSEKVKSVLRRIRDKSEDLYREAKEAIDGGEGALETGAPDSHGDRNAPPANGTLPE